MFDTLKTVRIESNIISEPSDIEGIGKMSELTQQIISDLIVKHKRVGLPDELTPATCKEPNRRVNSNKSLQFQNCHMTNARVSTSLNPNMPALTIMYTNADTLTSNKLAELKARIPNIKPHIIIVTEVKPKHYKERLMQDFTLNNFVIFGCDLTPNDDRGILIYVHESVSESISHFTKIPSFNETIFIEVKLKKGDKLLIGGIYRSPNSTSEVNNKAMLNLIRTVCNGTYSHICIVGDFNCPRINWHLRDFIGPEDSFESQFLNVVDDYFLYQHIDQPTRSRGTDNPSLLDLVLTNEENMVSNIQYHSPLGLSDHVLISFKFNCYTEAMHYNRKVYLYNTVEEIMMA